MERRSASKLFCSKGTASVRLARVHFRLTNRIQKKMCSCDLGNGFSVQTPTHVDHTFERAGKHFALRLTAPYAIRIDLVVFGYCDQTVHNVVG